MSSPPLQFHSNGLPPPPTQGNEGQPGMEVQQQWTPEQTAAYYQQYGGYDQQQQQQPQYGAYDYSAGWNPQMFDWAAYYAQYYGKSQEEYYGAYGQQPPPSGDQEPSRSVWLGNIHPDTTETELTASFAQFGMIEHVKVLSTKNCAFIRFVELDAAIQAHSAMYGATIHDQQIKIGWGKAEPERKEELGPPPCRNLWLGNMSEDVTEDQIRSIFGKFGQIEKVRMLPQKNCAFINFMKLEAAVTAKDQMQGVVIGDSSVKINFGKELTPAEKERERERERERMYDRPRIQEPPPPHAPPPSDLAQKAVIDKLADFVARNGLKFEEQLQEKQKENPKFAFIYEGHPEYAYYRLKIWTLRFPHLDPDDTRRRWEEQQSMPDGYPVGVLRPMAPPPGLYSNMPPPSTLYLGASQPTLQITGPGSEPPPQKAPEPVFPPSAEMGPEIAHLATLLDNLVPTKDSIKVSKSWIMQRPQIANDVADYILRRVERTRDFEQKLNVIYLIHDILHHSSRERNPGDTQDQFSSAFRPFLGAMLRYSYISEDALSQDKILKVVRIWADKGIYDVETVKGFEAEMGVDPAKEAEQKERDREREERRSHRSSRHGESSHRSHSHERSDRKRERDHRDRHDDRYEKRRH